MGEKVQLFELRDRDPRLPGRGDQSREAFVQRLRAEAHHRSAGHDLDAVSAGAGQAHIRPDIWANMSTGYAKLGPAPDSDARGLLRRLSGGCGGDDAGRPYPGAARLHESGELQRIPAPQAGDRGHHAVGAASEADSQNRRGRAGLVLRDMGKPDLPVRSTPAPTCSGGPTEYSAYPAQDFAVAIFTNHWPIRSLRYREHAATIVDFISLGSHASEASRASAAAAPGPGRGSYVMGLTLSSSSMAVRASQPSSTPT